MEEQWYSVKCVIEHHGLSDVAGSHVYEERITIFRASDFDQAIARAEREVVAYAQQNGANYLGYCNAYKLDAPTLEEGTEVCSVMREAFIPPAQFITRYHDDGTDKHG